MNDLRFAFRMLRKSPGFTAAAVLALAIGIGANSALFSVVSAVLFSPLPFRDPSRLVMVFSTQLDSGIPISTSSGLDFLQWQQQARSFEELGAIKANCKFNLSGHGEPVALKGALATPSFLAVFGVPTMLGRTFTAEDMAAGRENCLVLTHGAWLRQFGGDTNVLGRVVNVNDQPHVVVGVFPPQLGFVEGFMEAIAPLPKPRLAEDRTDSGYRSRYLTVFGRLKPGVTLTAAEAELKTIAAAVAQAYPDQTGWSVKLASLHEWTVKTVRPVFLVLHGAVAVVLLIACVNVANLLLARAETRQREMALRGALGAGLMVRNLNQLSALDPGFDRRNGLTLELELSGPRYTQNTARVEFDREIIRRLTVLPGVEAVGLVDILPMANQNDNWPFEIEGDPPPMQGTYRFAEHRAVNADYFRALRLPLKQGRAFRADDEEAARPVVIINEILARRGFAEANPLGRRITFPLQGESEGLEIIGVVGNERSFGLGADLPPVFYRPFTRGHGPGLGLALRTRTDPVSLANAARQQIGEVDPHLAVMRLRTLENAARLDPTRALRYE